MPEIKFALQGEYIELSKLLKVTGLCESGGQAKQAIACGDVRVNGAVEMRKAFKVRRGHIIEVSGERITVT